MALIGAACGDESAEQVCIRHSNCAMGWYCSAGICRSKTRTAVPVDAGMPVDSGLVDGGATDASLTDAQSDASATDASAADATVGADVQVDASSSTDANSAPDASVVNDADRAPDAQQGIDAAQAIDAAQSTDASRISDASQIMDAHVGSDTAALEAGVHDASVSTTDVDRLPDSGPLDGPTPDLAPDAGITDRGFGSFPLPSFDMGFGKPR